MYHRFACTVLLACCVIAPDACADKFYFGSEEESAKLYEGSSLDVIVGVLLAEDETTYTIRVEGGELTLQKSQVYKVEKDGMTVADIEKLETDDADRLAQADAERIQILIADAELVRADRVAAAEATARRYQEAVAAIDVAARDEIEPPVLPPFDPVVGARGVAIDGSSLTFEVEMLYRASKYPHLRKLMRIARRMN